MAKKEPKAAVPPVAEETEPEAPKPTKAEALAEILSRLVQKAGRYEDISTETAELLEIL